VKFGVRVWPVNGSMIKEELYRWLRLDRPTEEGGEPYPPGYCHFPKYSEEYFKQITAEQLVTKVVKGYRRTEWQKMRDRNKSLDTRTYARAAAAVAGMDRYTDVTWKTIEDNIAERAKRVGQPAAPATNQPQPLMRPVQLPVRGRFINNTPPPRRW
jgi:phage terminase large subunit GpA-like protein